jgi:hypothetical protein
LNDDAYEASEHLSGLKKLQHLVIWAHWDEPPEWYYGVACAAVPGQPFAAMLGLTRLEFNAFGLDTLEELSSCRNLQQLAVCMTRRSLRPADWGSISHLTQLTELRLLNADLTEANAEACEACSKLTKLQVAAAAVWSQAFVPALTACVRLTEVSGDWTWVGSSAGHVLPQVLVLEGMVIPANRVELHGAQLGLFPRLRHLRADVLVDGSQFLVSHVISPS